MRAQAYTIDLIVDDREVMWSGCMTRFASKRSGVQSDQLQLHFPRRFDVTLNQGLVFLCMLSSKHDMHILCHSLRKSMRAGCVQKPKICPYDFEM